MSEHFPESNSSGGRVKVKVDLFNYATKIDLNNAAVIDSLKFAKKVDLVDLKSNVDKLDIDELRNVPRGLSSSKSKVDKLNIGKLETNTVDLSKLSDVVKNELVKKT